MLLDVTYSDLHHITNALIDYKIYLKSQNFDVEEVDRIIDHLQTVLDQGILA